MRQMCSMNMTNLIKLSPFILLPGDRCVQASSSFSVFQSVDISPGDSHILLEATFFQEVESSSSYSNYCPHLVTHITTLKLTINYTPGQKGREHYIIGRK